MEQTRSDEMLVRAFQQGDRDAFAQFVERHQDRVFRLSELWLDRAELAPDALQETFARSYRGLLRFRFRAAPTSWLLRVCRNVCWEMNRRYRREVPLEADGALLPGDAQADADWLRDDAQRRIHRWLAALPARQREVVTLRKLEELSVTETARVMGCRPGTVKALLHKAMAALERAALDEGGR